MSLCPCAIPIHDVSDMLHRVCLTLESIGKFLETSKKSPITRGFFLKYAIIALHEGELRLPRAGDPLLRDHSLLR